jgi:uncharacterized repeat protein (TIGR02543 family)
MTNKLFSNKTRWLVTIILLTTLAVGQMWSAVTALTIPKSWASSDGSSSYTEALGCSNTSCLGSDYSSAPKLKFDGQGDYIIIQIASAPAYVTFNIKGNPGSGSWSGTFKVQESSNGSTYTDAASYTSLSSSSTSQTVSLSSATRYIKFNFVTKSNGNVGLGGVTIKARTSVTLDKNGGDADGSAVFAHNATAYESFTTVTRTGYTLNGYYTASSAGTKVLNADGSRASSSISGWWSSNKWAKDAATAKLYAQWSAKTYGITLDRNGASSGSTSVTMTYNSSSHTAITAPTRDGYTFDGWYDSESNNNGTGNQIMNASGVLQANAGTYTGAGGIWILDDEVTLYAKWTAAVVCSDPTAPSNGSFF